MSEKGGARCTHAPRDTHTYRHTRTHAHHARTQTPPPQLGSFHLATWVRQGPLETGGTNSVGREPRTNSPTPRFVTISRGEAGEGVAGLLGRPGSTRWGLGGGKKHPCTKTLHRSPDACKNLQRGIDAKARGLPRSARSRSFRAARSPSVSERCSLDPDPRRQSPIDFMSWSNPSLLAGGRIEWPTNSRMQFSGPNERVGSKHFKTLYKLSTFGVMSLSRLKKLSTLNGIIYNKTKNLEYEHQGLKKKQIEERTWVKC